MDGSTRARRLVLALILAVVASACGSTESTGQTDGAGDQNSAATTSTTTTTTTVAADEGNDDNSDPAAAAQTVLDALDDEADALVEPTAQYIARKLEGAGLDANIALCAQELDIRGRTASALPEAIGDIRVDDAYTAMRASYLEFVSAQATACDRLEEEREEVEADGDLFTKLQMELGEFGEAADLACFDAVEPFAVYGRLNCLRESDVQPSIDLGALADAQTNDADPLAGPTGGATQPWVEIPAGSAELAWFARPFSVDHSEPLNLQTADDYVWFTQTPDGATFGMYALDTVADPEDLGLFELRGTVPIADDLSDWFTAMPVTVTGTSELEVGGAPATLWEFEPDREASIEATGDVSVTLAGSVVHPHITIVAVAEFPEQHLLWHVRTSGGPVLVHLIESGFGERAFAESVLASLTFG